MNNLTEPAFTDELDIQVVCDICRCNMRLNLEMLAAAERLGMGEKVKAMNRLLAEIYSAASKRQAGSF